MELSSVGEVWYRVTTLLNSPAKLSIGEELNNSSIGRTVVVTSTKLRMAINRQFKMRLKNILRTGR